MHDPYEYDRQKEIAALYTIRDLFSSSSKPEDKARCARCEELESKLLSENQENKSSRDDFAQIATRIANNCKPVAPGVYRATLDLSRKDIEIIAKATLAK